MRNFLTSILIFKFKILHNYVYISLVAQRLKHLPPVWETLIHSLGREDPLKKEMVTHSSILDWEIPWTEDWQAIVHRSRAQLGD